MKLGKVIWLLVLATCAGCQFRTRPQASATTDEPVLESTHFKETLVKAEKGDAKAQYQVGQYYFSGPKSVRDRTNAVSWFRQAADQNYAKAETALGRCYLNGAGVATDSREGMRWLGEAVKQHEPYAETMTAGMALWGFSVGTNVCVDPVRCLQNHASQGNSLAQVILGEAYLHGKGVTKSQVEAIKWFRLAAVQGEPGSQAAVGEAYLKGTGVKQNITEGVRWIRMAADKGDPNGELILGTCYEKGNGLSPDLVEAAKWYRRAAEQGDQEARYSIGLAYRDGRGVDRDYMQAYHWLDLAAHSGSSKVGTARAELRDRMTTQQLAQAGVVPRRHLTPFNRAVIDAHEQRYEMSCIPSSVEMVLKLTGRVPGSYYEQQDWWKNKDDGSFHNFDGKTIAGVTFRQQFTQARNGDFPLAKLFDAIDSELKAGRYVIVGLRSGPGFHNWVIYDEDENGEFLAVSKAQDVTIENNHVRKTITDMEGTDIGTYEVQN